MPHLRPEHQQALDAFCIPLGKRVTALRIGQKMTLTELAKLVELDVGRVFEIESGKPIPLWTTRKFADALHVTVEILLFGEIHRLPPPAEISRTVRDIAIRMDSLAGMPRQYVLRYLDLILTHHGR